MLFRLRRWYNQNSKKIWKVTGIVVFLLIILRVLNYYAGHKSKIEYNPDIEVSTKNEYTDLSLSTDKSVLSGEKITSSQLDAIDAINQFFAYCNSKKVSEAYSLLTDKCKTKLYPNIKYFENNYYNILFKRRN